MRDKSILVSDARGFSLVELMVVVIIGAILAGIALPAYQNYVKSSRAKTAAADLASLSAAVENVFQRRLQYPSTTGTAQFTTWSTSQDRFFTFDYTPPVAGSSLYTLEATGVNQMAGCVLTFKSDNTRTASGDCGGYNP